MCRVALFNKEGERHIESTYGLLKFLDRLEKECGGHGNGLSLMKDGQIIYLNKGLKYTNEMIVKKLMRTDYDHAVYHTRIKSIGEVSTKNCHPYRSGNTVLAMNGTEQGFASVAKMLDITDSEAILRTSVAFNKDIRNICADFCSATFIGFYKGMPWLVAGNSSWSGLQFVKEGSMYVFASTLPADFKDRKQVSGKRAWYFPTDSLDDMFFSEVRDLSSYADSLSKYGQAYRTTSPAVVTQGKNIVKTATGWQHVHAKTEDNEVIIDEEEYYPGRWAFTKADVDMCRE